MRNETCNCIYNYINLLYYKQRSLLHVLTNCYVHRQEDIL